MAARSIDRSREQQSATQHQSDKAAKAGPMSGDESWKAGGPDGIFPRQSAAQSTTSRGEIALYNPYHPSVLFDALRKGLYRRIGIDNFASSLGKWLRKRRPAPRRSENPRHPRERIVGKDKGRCLLDSGLIIPSQKDVFLLTRPESGEAYILEERRKRASERKRAAANKQ